MVTMVTMGTNMLAFPYSNPSRIESGGASATLIDVHLTIALLGEVRELDGDTYNHEQHTKHNNADGLQPLGAA